MNAAKLAKPGQPLTSREQEVCRVLAETGASDVVLAKRLKLSRYTLKDHLKAIFIKLGVENRTQIVIEWNRRKGK